MQTAFNVLTDCWGANICANPERIPEVKSLFPFSLLCIVVCCYMFLLPAIASIIGERS